MTVETLTRPEISTPGRLTRRRAAYVLASLCLLLLATSVWALSTGSETVPFGQIAASIASWMTGTPSRITAEQEAIIFGLRLPRLMLAIGVGAALATAGAAFQALLRNPLADPYVLGVSGGAALGSIISIIFMSQYAVSRPLFGFVGAVLATLVVYGIGRRDDNPAHLVLAGIVISTFLSSVIVLLTALAEPVRLRNITLWLLGDLSSGTTEGTVFVIASSLVGGAVLLTQTRALNLMMIGERDAYSMGVETARVRWIVHLTASLLTGAAVAAGGAIGYVGLVVPHLVRLGTGADNRLVIPASAITGAILVLVSDTAARTVLAPRELPTGAITALAGAPVFIYLLVKSRS